MPQRLQHFASRFLEVWVAGGRPTPSTPPENLSEAPQVPRLPE